MTVPSCWHPPVAPVPVLGGFAIRNIHNPPAR